MRDLSEIIPILSDLEPEEIGRALLACLNDKIEASSNANHTRNMFTFVELTQPPFVPKALQKEQAQVLAEGWRWLEVNGLIALDVSQPHNNWWKVTRHGRAIKSANDVGTFRLSKLLPPEVLHSRIRELVRRMFLRGEYDAAVFQAFREVEIAVREAASLKDTDLGTVLMRRAFDPSCGPLRDPSVPAAEQEAMAHLFAGAIGLYKNPRSHRRVDADGPAEAVEMILLASHLLRLVDNRRP